MELKPEYLRTGNTVHYFSEGEYSENTIDWQDLQWLDEDPKGFNMVHFPIPLTEDILLKLGFKRFCKDWAKKGIIIHTRKRGFVLKKSVPDIKYVHQLQNLYHSLTGEELKLKEK